MTLKNILLRAIGSIGAISLGFSTTFFAIQSPSLAQNRTICNNTGKDLNIALGYLDGFSAGWYNVDKGLCLNLSNFDGKHGAPAYYFAKAKNVFDNSVWGRADALFCVKYGKAFEGDYDLPCTPPS